MGSVLLSQPAIREQIYNDTNCVFSSSVVTDNGNSSGSRITSPKCFPGY